MKFIQKIGMFFVLFVLLFPIGLGAMGTKMSRTEACAVLGVSDKTQEEVINAAYRKLARQWHPDQNKSPNATIRMQEINAAKDILLKALQYEQANGQENSENMKARKDSALRIINEKKENLTLYDLIGVTQKATDIEIIVALEQFAPIWECFDAVIEVMIPNHRWQTHFEALSNTLKFRRQKQEYDDYLLLSDEQKLTHERFRPWSESFAESSANKNESFSSSLKKEALEIAAESLMGLAGGVAAGAAYLGLAALTKSPDCMKTLPAVVSFYGYTTLVAALGFSIGMKAQKKQSWSSLFGIGARALVFGAVTKYAAPYVVAGFKWASII